MYNSVFKQLSEANTIKLNCYVIFFMKHSAFIVHLAYSENFPKGIFMSLKYKHSLDCYFSLAIQLAGKYFNYKVLNDSNSLN